MKTKTDPQIELSQKMIAEIRTWEPFLRADFYDHKVIEIEERERRTYVEFGLVLIEMEQGELYKYLLDPLCRACGKTTQGRATCKVCKAVREYFHSFDRWLIARAPVSRTTGYAAKHAVERGLEAGLTISQMNGMHRANLDAVTKLPSAVLRDPAVVEMAQSKSYDDLLVALEHHYPQTHIESRRQLVLKPTKSARSIIDDAIRAAEALHELEGREAAIEYICAAWLHETCQIEEFAGLNNLQAYLRRRSAAA
jgi:hypothetical protein